MTKIDLKLSQKTEEGEKKLADVMEATTAVTTVEMPLNDETEPTEEKKVEERVSIEEILASVGLDAGTDDEFYPPPPATMDWGFIRRICTAQIILSAVRNPLFFQ